MTSATSKNPLSKLKNLSLRHLLIAFECSTDAYSYEYDYNVGDVGTRFSGGCGEAIVVVNEFKSTVTNIHRASTIWNFYSPIHFRTSSYSGSMEIIDRSSFFFNELIKDFTEALEISQNHLTFFWVTEFSGYNEQHVREYHYSKPMFFHVTDMLHDASHTFGNSYIFNFVSCYNTFGMSAQFSTVLRNTINHRDSNTINTAPAVWNPSSGLKSTREEDSLKLSGRVARLDKTKYMKTVEDFCNAFEYALTKQTNPHNKQLQTFLTIIRNDYSQKISDVKKFELPIVYKIKPDDYYKLKTLDNRNLPFEQYEINENIHGLSTITFPLGISIQSAITEVLGTSKSIGKDHIKDPINTFKIITSVSKECDGKYHVYSKINKFVSPYNSDTLNTGPGNGLVNDELFFRFQDPYESDDNLLSLTYGASNNTISSAIEKVSDDEDIQAVYGDRELQTSIREVDGVNFFKNAFSGLKLARGISRDNGLQNSENASLISNFTYSQPTSYILRVVGNPNFLSDLNRNTQEVIDDVDLTPLIYKFSEYEPMYLKLRIYLRGDRKLETKPPTDSPMYYFENYLHIYKVVNLYNSGEFIQLLYAGRTNEKL